MPSNQTICAFGNLVLKWDKNIVQYSNHSTTSSALGGGESWLVNGVLSSISPPKTIQFTFCFIPYSIANLIAKQDYEGIAEQIEKSKRLWEGKGLDGLVVRREAEADLVRDSMA